jgi:hypothetical protein
MDLNGIISNQNGDEHLGAKDVTIKKNTSFELESLTTNISNQSIIKDIIDLVFESVIKLSHRYFKDISKHIYELKISSKFKYHMSHYVSILNSV